MRMITLLGITWLLQAPPPNDDFVLRRLLTHCASVRLPTTPDKATDVWLCLPAEACGTDRLARDDLRLFTDDDASIPFTWELSWGDPFEAGYCMGGLRFMLPAHRSVQLCFGGGRLAPPASSDAATDAPGPKPVQISFVDNGAPPASRTASLGPITVNASYDPASQLPPPRPLGVASQAFRYRSQTAFHIDASAPEVTAIVLDGKHAQLGQAAASQDLCVVDGAGRAWPFWLHWRLQQQTEQFKNGGTLPLLSQRPSASPEIRFTCEPAPPPARLHALYIDLLPRDLPIDGLCVTAQTAAGRQSNCMQQPVTAATRVQVIAGGPAVTRVQLNLSVAHYVTPPSAEAWMRQAMLFVHAPPGDYRLLFNPQGSPVHEFITQTTHLRASMRRALALRAQTATLGRAQKNSDFNEKKIFRHDPLDAWRRAAVVWPHTLDILIAFYSGSSWPSVDAPIMSHTHARVRFDDSPAGWACLFICSCSWLLGFGLLALLYRVRGGYLLTAIIAVLRVFLFKNPENEPWPRPRPIDRPIKPLPESWLRLPIAPRQPNKLAAVSKEAPSAPPQPRPRRKAKVAPEKEPSAPSPPTRQPAAPPQQAAAVKEPPAPPPSTRVPAAPQPPATVKDELAGWSRRRR